MPSFNIVLCSSKRFFQHTSICLQYVERQMSTWYSLRVHTRCKMSWIILIVAASVLPHKWLVPNFPSTHDTLNTGSHKKVKWAQIRAKRMSELLPISLSPSVWKFVLWRGPHKVAEMWWGTILLKHDVWTLSFVQLRKRKRFKQI